jgi:hypothetical protein
MKLKKGHFFTMILVLTFSKTSLYHRKYELELFERLKGDVKRFVSESAPW